jgi:hypothetical protein
MRCGSATQSSGHIIRWCRVRLPGAHMQQSREAIMVVGNRLSNWGRVLVELFGSVRGRHARTAMGVTATPLCCPVILAAEIASKRD